jgi:hypothetical protein
MVDKDDARARRRKAVRSLIHGIKDPELRRWAFQLFTEGENASAPDWIPEQHDEPTREDADPEEPKQ